MSAINSPLNGDEVGKVSVNDCDGGPRVKRYESGLDQSPSSLDQSAPMTWRFSTILRPAHQPVVRSAENTDDQSWDDAPSDKLVKRKCSRVSPELQKRGSVPYSAWQAIKIDHEINDADALTPVSASLDRSAVDVSKRKKRKTNTGWARNVDDDNSRPCPASPSSAPTAPIISDRPKSRATHLCRINNASKLLKTSSVSDSPGAPDVRANTSDAQESRLYERALKGARKLRLRATNTMIALVRSCTDRPPTEPIDARDEVTARTATEKNTDELKRVMTILNSDLETLVWPLKGIKDPDDVGFNLCQFHPAWFHGKVHIDIVRGDISAGLLYALQEYPHRGIRKGRIVKWTDGTSHVTPGARDAQGGISVIQKDEMTGQWAGQSWTVAGGSSDLNNDHYKAYAITAALWTAHEELLQQGDRHPVWSFVQEGRRPVVAVFSDSQDILLRLQSPMCYDEYPSVLGALVYWSLKLKGMGVDVELHWIEGHNLAGSEAADCLAGHAARVVHDHTGSGLLCPVFCCF